MLRHSTKNGNNCPTAPISTMPLLREEPQGELDKASSKRGYSSFKIKFEEEKKKNLIFEH